MPHAPMRVNLPISLTEEILCYEQDAIFESASQSPQGNLTTKAVAEFCLKTILVPGEVSLSALADTLTELGKPTTREQLQCQSSSQIVNFLVEVSSVAGLPALSLYTYLTVSLWASS